jgi:Protein of unknown function (DUF3293)
MHRDIRVNMTQSRNSFGRAEHAEKFDPPRTPFFERGNRSDRRSAGREHGVEYQTEIFGSGCRKLAVVRHGNQLLFIAVEAEMAHRRVREEPAQAIGHPQAGAQDRYQSDTFAEACALTFRQGRAHRADLGREVGCGLDAKQQRELFDQLAEVIRGSILGPQPSQFVQDRRMVRHEGLRHGVRIAMEQPEANPEQEGTPSDSVDWVELYQSSRYAFPAGEAWRVFALDGEDEPYLDLERSVTLITAWNPDSSEQERAWNATANARLASELAEAGEEFEASWGASLPGVKPAWREAGFAVYGWTREQARDWGQRFGQRAVVYLDAESAELVFCVEAWAVVCGLRCFPDQPRGDGPAGS